MTTNTISNKNETRLSGLILAGGRGSRMQGIDKGLVAYNGKCMIEHCIEKLSPQVENIVISANQNIEQYAAYGFTVLQDNSKDFQGPLAGLLRALETSKGQPILVVPCDAPLLPAHLAKRLLSYFNNQELAAAIPHDGKRLQPLFGMYSPGCMASLVEYLSSGQRKVTSWVESLPHVVVDFSDSAEKFININTADDLKTAESLFIHDSQE